MPTMASTNLTWSARRGWHSITPKMINERKNQALRRQRLEAARSIGTHTVADWLRLVELCGNRCVACGATASQKDHIVPIYCGGSDAISNLQPLCGSCNAGKNGREDLRPPAARQFAQAVG